MKEFVVKVEEGLLEDGLGVGRDVGWGRTVFAEVCLKVNVATEVAFGEEGLSWVCCPGGGDAYFFAWRFECGEGFV
jgi:hypothetical protein